MVPKVPVVVTLSPAMAQQVLASVGLGTAYPTISDLVTAALGNQFSLSGQNEVQLLSSPEPRPENWGDDMLARPPKTTEQMAERLAAHAGLGPFTNRLAPMIVPIRYLANLQLSTGPVPWSALAPSAIAARQLGLKLRKEDKAQGRKGLERRWVGWPVGDDESSSLNRFRRHFIGRVDRALLESPLIALGLVGPLGSGAHFGLTKAGWDLCQQRTPMLGEAPESDNGVFSPSQQSILASALFDSHEELRLIHLLLDQLAKGQSLAAIDAAFRSEQPHMSEAVATSTRAAVIGRLLDAGVLKVKNHQIQLGEARQRGEGIH